MQKFALHLCHDISKHIHSVHATYSYIQTCVCVRTAFTYALFWCLFSLLRAVVVLFVPPSLQLLALKCSCAGKTNTKAPKFMQCINAKAQLKVCQLSGGKKKTIPSAYCLRFMSENAHFCRWHKAFRCEIRFSFAVFIYICLFETCSSAPLASLLKICRCESVSKQMWIYADVIFGFNRYLLRSFLLPQCAGANRWDVSVAIIENWNWAGHLHEHVIKWVCASTRKYVRYISSKIK